MCFSANSSIYGVGGCFLFAEISAAAIHFGIAAAFFVCFFPKLSSPFNFGDGNGRLPTAVSPNIPEAGV